MDSAIAPDRRSTAAERAEVAKVSALLVARRWLATVARLCQRGEELCFLARGGLH